MKIRAGRFILFCGFESGGADHYTSLLCPLYQSSATFVRFLPVFDYITVLVVVGTKEKPYVEEILPECTIEMQNIYNQTQEGNG